MLNQGSTGTEIAEEIAAAPALESAWHARGYYGSVSHNVKAIYQRYMGWFDGNPAPVAAPAAGGGAPATSTSSAASTRCSPRPGSTPTPATCGSPPNCSSTPCSPTRTTTAARELLADVYEQLGYGAENATWRNFYLIGALELRDGGESRRRRPGRAGMAAALTIEQLFDTLAIRVDGPRAGRVPVIDWNFTDPGHTYRLALSNGALIQTVNPQAGRPPTSPSP